MSILSNLSEMAVDAIHEILAAITNEQRGGIGDEFAFCAVNWGDLRCARYVVVNIDGKFECAEATLEECSPDATELFSYVEEELAKRGFPGVSVRGEW